MFKIETLRADEDAKTLKLSEKLFHEALIKRPFMAKYFFYDENEKDTLYLDYFNGLKNMVFEELNEYTIAVSKMPSDRYVNNAVKVLLEATAGL